RIVAAFRYYARVAAIWTVSVGCLVVAGWLLHIPRLTSIRADWAAMKPVSALAFVLLGAALLLICGPVVKRLQRIAAANCSLAVIIGSILSLVDYSVIPGYGSGGAATDQPAKLDG